MNFTVLAILANREERNLPYAVVRHGSSLQLTVSKDDVPENARLIDVRCDEMTAKAGEKGYIVCSAAPNTGDLLCEFNKREESEGVFRQPLLPLFGLKREGFCAAAMVTGGNLELEHVVSVENGVYSVFARFEPEKPLYEDISIVYRLLDGEDADYSGMARAYRTLRLESGLVRPLSERMKTSPELRHAADTIYVRIRQAWKPVPSPVPEQTVENEPPMRVAVSFDRAGELMDEFHRQGIADADFCLVGWNQKGHDGRYPQLFPVEEQLGGEEKLRALIEHAHKLGYSIDCHTNSTDAYRIADCFSEDDLILRADGSPSMNSEGWSAGNMYHLCAEAALKLAHRDLPRVAALGFHGLHYIDVISVVWPRDCFSAAHPMTKRQTAEKWLDIMRLARAEFGGIASEGCFDFAAPELDYGLYQGFNLLGELPRIAQRRIPLWSLVYHGVIMSNPSAETVNYPVKDWLSRLKFIEYGCHPAIYIHSKFLSNNAHWMGTEDFTAGTPEEIGQSAALIRQSLDDYRAVQDLALTAMVRHEHLTDSIVCVTYENGARILCNYGEDAYCMDGTVVPPHDFIVLRP